MRGTETSLQTFSIFISSVGLFQSLFDSQVTFTQAVFFSQEHTFSGRPGGILQLGKVKAAESILAIL